MGAIIVADTVRPEAVRAVQALEQMRLKIVLLPEILAEWLGV
jgi:cation transport ATPase